MGVYQYLSGATWTDVPDHAHPDDDAGSVMVEYPPPTARDGTGLPCGAIGGPRIVIRASQMIGTGVAWYQAFFTLATDLYASITGLTAYNPRTATWKKYSGTMLRATYGGIRPADTAGRTIYRDVEIFVENLTEL